MLKFTRCIQVGFFSLLICFSFAKMGMAATGDICVDFYVSGGNTTNCVKTADINASAVTGAKIAGSTITNSNIANSTITGGKIASGTVTGSNIASSTVTSSNIANATVTGAKIAAGTVTGSNVAVGTITGSNIASATVTGANIAASTITGSKIAAGTITPSNIQPIANRVVVAPSGGDFATISAALAAINPSASTPYVIDVMPGNYIENITMKSYVHLRGAGRDLTTIQSPSTSTNVIDLINNPTNIIISGFSITGGQKGINFGTPYISSGSYFITGNTISGNSIAGIDLQCFNPSNVSVEVSGNKITGNSNYGMNVGCYSSTLVKIANNSITGNSGGISIFSYPQIRENVITGNAVDVFIDPSSTPNISFNTYDLITGGGRGLGQFNVNSAGGLAPAP